MARGCILTVLLMLAGSGMCQSVAQTIPDGYAQVARAHGIPAEVLYAVSLTETAMAPGDMAGVMQYSRRDGRLPDASRPWPWTINVAGKGYRYASRLEAWQALQVFLKRYPARRIDVGIAQVNLGWNGHRFPSTWAAFDPYTSSHSAGVPSAPSRQLAEGCRLLSSSCRWKAGRPLHRRGQTSSGPAECKKYDATADSHAGTGCGLYLDRAPEA